MNESKIIRKVIADIEENLSNHEDRKVELCLEQARLAAMIEENILIREALLSMLGE